MKEYVSIGCDVFIGVRSSDRLAGLTGEHSSSLGMQQWTHGDSSSPAHGMSHIGVGPDFLFWGAPKTCVH